MSVLFGRNPRATAIRVATIIVTAIVVFGFVLLPVRLRGISMLPTYHDGQINFANRLAYVWRSPARGDVVAIRMAGPGVVYVKRIVGLPRERVRVAAGVVLVNDEPLVEPSVVRRSPWDVPETTLGDDEYYVIGDNRSMPAASHDFGRTTRDRIVGKMLF